MAKQYVSVLVGNAPGVLQRVSGLFSRRGYNIDSITVGVSEQESLSRMTVVANGDGVLVGQLCNQLRKLIDVVSAEPLGETPFISRELLLVKLNSDPVARAGLNELIHTFRCSIVDVGPSSLIVQAVGDRDKNEAFLKLLAPYGIIEITRTGETAMARG
ncbi:acetolactate synthase small subunit [Cohnella soli]|uniref:Acetolactate synthase small subunit n=1 Tax=Cohnella soli TaxID=425005 RepID=A0ABW0HMD0_9BACL